MPRKPQIPEHWKEGATQPPWTGEADDYVEPMSDDDVRDVERMSEQMQPEEPSDFIMGDDKTADEMVNGNELLDLKTELAEREKDLAYKQEVRSTKRKIRRIKYKPAYDIGASLKEGVGASADKIRAMRGTPQQRQIRKEKFKRAIQKFGKAGGGAMDRMGGFGGGEEYYYDDDAIEMDRPPRSKQKTKPAFGQDMFGMGGGIGVTGMNLLGETKKGQGMDLLGGGSGMGMNLLGTQQPPKMARKRKKPSISRRKKTYPKKKKTTRKRKTTTKKKGKKRRKKRTSKPKTPVREPIRWI